MIEHKDVVIGGLMAIKSAAKQEIRIRIEAAISFIESTHSDREIFKEQARAAGVELKAERDVSTALRSSLERVTRKLEKAKAKAGKRREMLREACGAHLDDTFTSLLAYISDLRERHKHLRSTLIRAQDAIPDVRWTEGIDREKMVSAINAMNERSSAWLSVVSALDEHVPNWRTGSGETEALLAVEAIRKLAAFWSSKLPLPSAPVEVPEGWLKASPDSALCANTFYDFILSNGERINGCRGMTAISMLDFEYKGRVYVLAYRPSSVDQSDLAKANKMA